MHSLHGSHLKTLWSNLLVNPFRFQHFYVPFHSKFYTFGTRPANFSNTSSQERSLWFSHNFLYPIPLLRTMPLVQLLILKDTSRHFLLCFSAHFLWLGTFIVAHHAWSPSFIMCTISLSLLPSAATCSNNKTIYLQLLFSTYNGEST